MSDFFERVQAFTQRLEKAIRHFDPDGKSEYGSLIGEARDLASEMGGRTFAALQVQAREILQGPEGKALLDRAAGAAALQWAEMDAVLDPDDDPQSLAAVRERLKTCAEGPPIEGWSPGTTAVGRDDLLRLLEETATAEALRDAQAALKAAEAENVRLLEKYGSQTILQECMEVLTRSGMGAPGMPNTLWAMVREAVRRTSQAETLVAGYLELLLPARKLMEAEIHDEKSRLLSYDYVLPDARKRMREALQKVVRMTPANLSKRVRTAVLTEALPILSTGMLLHPTDPILPTLIRLVEELPAREPWSPGQ